jgi:DNA-binding transcriptional MerR regulator
MHMDTQVTTGKLAQAAGVLPSTIRFYVKQGLLSVAGQTQGGFFLFDLASSLQRLQHIQELKSRERLTIAEIRSRFAAEER